MSSERSTRARVEIATPEQGDFFSFSTSRLFSRYFFITRVPRTLKRKQRVFEQARILLAQQALTSTKMSEGLFVVWIKMTKLSIFIYLFCSVSTFEPATTRFTGEIRGEQSYYNCRGKLFNPFMTAGEQRKNEFFTNSSSLDWFSVIQHKNV